MKQLIWIGLLILGLIISLTPSLQAQDVIDPNSIPVSNAIPENNSLQANFSNAPDVTLRVDQLLKLNPGEIMNGLSDYAVDIKDLLLDKALDEAVKAIADALVLAPLAEEVMSAYQKVKDKNLASEIDKVKSLAKYSLNKQLKTKFQDFKIKYARMDSKWKTVPDIKGSVASSLAENTRSSLWGAHVDMLNEYYDGSDKQAIMEYRYPELGNVPGNRTDYSYTAFATDAKLLEDADQYHKTLSNLSDQEFDLDRNDDGALVAYSQYDRLMMKRKLYYAMKGRLRGINAVKAKVQDYVQGQLQQRDKQKLANSLGAKDAYMKK